MAKGIDTKNIIVVVSTTGYSCLVFITDDT